MFFEVASVIIDAIWMFEFAKEANFFEDVLPLFQRLLAAIGHLFDGHDLHGDIISCIINGTETSMANFPQIVKQFLRIFTLKKLRYLGILQTARPEKIS